jgi:hypothetical protein
MATEIPQLIAMIVESSDIRSRLMLGRYSAHTSTGW